MPASFQPTMKFGIIVLGFKLGHTCAATVVDRTVFVGFERTIVGTRLTTEPKSWMWA